MLAGYGWDFWSQKWPLNNVTDFWGGLYLTAGINISQINKKKASPTAEIFKSGIQISRVEPEEGWSAKAVSGHLSVKLAKPQTPVSRWMSYKKHREVV